MNICRSYEKKKKSYVAEFQCHTRQNNVHETVPCKVQATTQRTKHISYSTTLQVVSGYCKDQSMGKESYDISTYTRCKCNHHKNKIRMKYGALVQLLLTQTHIMRVHLGYVVLCL